MPLFVGCIINILSLIVVLSRNGQLLDCATVAFSERYTVTVRRSLWRYIEGGAISGFE